MTVVRSTAGSRRAKPVHKGAWAHARLRESLLLLISTAVVAVGLLLVYEAKVLRPTPFADVESMLAGGRLLDLNRVTERDALLPFLTNIDNPADREFAAEKIYAYLRDAPPGGVPNIGALAKLRAGESEIDARTQLDAYRRELEAARQREAARDRGRAARGDELRIPLLRELGELKPALVVRSPTEFRRSLLIWTILYMLFFYVVHAVWSVRGFNGDELLLPLAHLLTGVGLILMVSLRDPLRDTLSFVNYSQGVIAGCLTALAFSQVDTERHFGWSRYIPLSLAVALSAVLVIFGSGPGTSDAKVNLLGFQPVEIIKLLVILFLAGYFAREWEVLRELRQKPPVLSELLRHVGIPRLDYVLPVVVGVGLVMIFFLLQKDLGPALVLSCVFLALYAVARNRALMALFGLSAMAACFYVGYRFSLVKTVVDRINIWMSPWDNAVPGGEQVVHSFWALATGGIAGTGLGLGDPGLVPAVHTDLILAAAGEELGFAGLLAIFALYVVLIHKGIRIALTAPSHYTFFLALGLTLLMGFQVLLISLGMLGLVPLSGVVSPFLSYGRTGMLANFAILGVLISISGRAGPQERHEFRAPVRWATVVLAVLAVSAAAKAAYVQVLRADETVVRSTLAPQADGVRRFHYNPRVLQAARLVPRGSIYDATGIPLATSDWRELEQHRDVYEELLGGKLEDFCSRRDNRHYPFGAYTFHLLGDVRTRRNWGASNTAYVERDSIVRLQGFDDHAEDVLMQDSRSGRKYVERRRDFSDLVPLLRYRHLPESEAVQRILNRRRDVRLSINIRLQMRVAAILRSQAQAARRERGAIVVLDADTGDVLASVSLPLPEGARAVTATDGDERERLLDRARFGRYPPGSTFKLVTAMAALRKSTDLSTQTFECVPVGGGRVGNFVRGWGAPIRDDIGDSAHGHVNMEQAIKVSCNAYFAQLGTYSVGAEALLRTAELFGIDVATPNTPQKLADAIPQASFGQGQVTATPFEMSRAAATVAAGGKMPRGRWVVEGGGDEPPNDAIRIINGDQASQLARAMRLVVTGGTATRLRDATPPVAGKTGTAEVDGKDPHSWFVGFAPYDVRSARRIAFSIIIENGGYGGRVAVPAAVPLIAAARDLGIIN
jgi:cell division protein FtsW (lipid II flippase)